VIVSVFSWWWTKEFDSVPLDELRARVLGFVKYQTRKSVLNELFHSAEEHEKAPNRIRTQEAKRLCKQAWQMDEQQANELVNKMDQSQ
jgi:hypothetical protein